MIDCDCVTIFLQKNVYEELHCIFGNDDRDVTEEDLKKMVYLEQVLKEVMRHFPIVPFLFRTNKETTTLSKAFKLFIC